MSLLDTGNESILVFLEETFTDTDGNSRKRPAAVGTPAIARIEVKGQSGTAARRAEQDNEGDESEKVYSMRLPRSWSHGELGPQAQVLWRSERWTVFGFTSRHNRSRSTAHNVYTIKRF